jgi:6-hydroxymethylpterin diphosphokinase MptE-like
MSSRMPGQRLDLRTRIRNIFDRTLLFPQDIQWHFGRERRQSRQRLAALKDRHLGERCFIIGNGPSLQRTDLSRLRKEFTFGMNRIYLLFDKLGFSTTYYVAINRLVIEQCAQDIVNIPSPKFISWWAHDLIKFTPDMMFVRDSFLRPLSFSTDAARAVREGNTVTYAAMQLAYYLGFQQVILVGVDHKFQTQGDPNAIVMSTGSDPNHFDPNYFGKGFRWQLPDLEGSERSYRLAKLRFEQAGRQILDATVDGQLQIFPKIRYDEILSGPPRRPDSPS